VERDAHDALELGRERVQNARKGPIEVVFAIVQRFAAEIISLYNKSIKHILKVTPLRKMDNEVLDSYINEESL
jgi:hypothetical protein